MSYCMYVYYAHSRRLTSYLAVAWNQLSTSPPMLVHLQNTCQDWVAKAGARYEINDDAVIGALGAQIASKDKVSLCFSHLIQTLVDHLTAFLLVFPSHALAIRRIILVGRIYIGD